MWVFTAWVAIIFGVSHSVTTRASRRLTQLPSVMLVVEKDATTPIQSRFLVVQARHHPFVNAITLLNELRNADGVNISTQTVHNSLWQSGLRSRRACIHISLTRHHKQTRLNWAQFRVNWTDNDWDHVLFTDE